MTARDDLYDALVEGDGRIETMLRADRLIADLEAEVLGAAADRIRKACPETKSSFDQGCHAAAGLIDPANADLLDPRKLDSDLACDCGELTCPCGCQAGERESHWIHSRSCNTQKRRP